MPGSTPPPDLGRETDRIIGRVEQRERKAGNKKTTYFTVPFSYPGPVFADVASPPWYADTPTTFTSLRMSLLVSGSVTIQVAVDGEPIAQYALTSGVTAVHAITLPVTPGSYLTVETVTVSGAENLSVIFKARTRG